MKFRNTLLSAAQGSIAAVNTVVQFQLLAIAIVPALIVDTCGAAGDLVYKGAQGAVDYLESKKDHSVTGEVVSSVFGNNARMVN